jgi:hypothetical protein
MNKYQQHITKILQNSSLIKQRNKIIHLIQRKPKPPPLTAQIKTHKLGKPIRPVVNNIHAPASKISKFLAKELNDYLKLKNCYNVKNSITLANGLVKLKMHKSFSMTTFDIKNLYINIPIHETINITRTLLLEHNDRHITKQMITLLQIILSGFGGLVVSMLAFGTQDSGFAPSRSRWIFRVKNPQHDFLQKGSKAVCPMSQICSMSKNTIIYRGSRKL